MKVCPICREEYADESLNYCLNDGGALSAVKDDVPPTIFMNQTRRTNPNWPGDYQPPTYQNQQITPHQPFGIQGQNHFQQNGQDQTLPTISLILGILSIVLFCCYGGVPFGIAAAVTGFIGMNNANSNSIQYGGKGRAIAGMILGASGILITLLLIIFAIAAG